MLNGARTLFIICGVLFKRPIPEQEKFTLKCLFLYLKPVIEENNVLIDSHSEIPHRVQTPARPRHV